MLEILRIPRIGASLSRLGGFGALPLLSTLAPFLLLPIVSRNLPVNGWTAFLLSQAVGSVCATVVTFGWGISGQARIALEKSTAVRVSIYAESIRVRILILFPAAILGCAVSVLLSGWDNWVLACLVCVSTTFGGMSLSWYGIGAGSPKLILHYEAIPRLVATGLSIPLVLFLHEVAWYPILLTAGTIVGLSLFWQYIAKSLEHNQESKGSVLRSLRSNSTVAVIGLIDSLYTSAPIPIAAAILASDLSSRLASLDKFYHYGLLTIIVLGNALTSWVLSSTGRRLRRTQAATLMHVVLGVVGGAIIWIAGPMLCGLLFGSRYMPDFATSGFYGIAFASISISTACIRYVLVPNSRSRFVLLGNIVAVLVGIPLMISLGSSGPSGIAVGLAASEATWAVICFLSARPKLLPRSDSTQLA